MSNHVGVLDSLPADLKFLAEPAIRFSDPQRDLTPDETLELASLAAKVRELDSYRRVEEFIDSYSWDQHPECQKMYMMFKTMDKHDLIYQNYLMSFATDDTGTMVSIHLDKNGVDRLLDVLTDLRDGIIAAECPHSHLWAEEDLTKSKLENSAVEQRNVTHVKIYGWNDEWAKKHHLRPH